MFKGMKPLPKALIIGAIVALPIWGYVQFAPKREPKVEAPVAATQPVQAVPAETSQPAPVPAPVVQAAPPAQTAPSGLTPATNDAGLDAVLRATKK